MYKSNANVLAVNKENNTKILTYIKSYDNFRVFPNKLFILRSPCVYRSPTAQPLTNSLYTHCSLKVHVVKLNVSGTVLIEDTRHNWLFYFLKLNCYTVYRGLLVPFYVCFFHHSLSANEFKTGRIATCMSHIISP